MPTIGAVKRTRLLREARVRDRLLIAGHRRGEDRLAGLARTLGTDGLAGEDGAVLEREKGAHPTATRPSATVVGTLPRSVFHDSQEFAE